MNNTLVINNQIITTLEDLRSCINQPEAAVSNSSLFNELIDRFVDGDIEGFLRIVGEETLAEKVKGIPIVDSDSELMRELIVAMTELDVNVDFNPLEYIKVEKTDIVLSDDGRWKANIDFSIVKQANEKVDFIIRQNDRAVRGGVHLMEKKIGQLLRLSMYIMPEGGLVKFFVDGKKIDEKSPPKTLFSIM